MGIERLQRDRRRIPDRFGYRASSFYFIKYFKTWICMFPGIPKCCSLFSRPLNLPQLSLFTFVCACKCLNTLSTLFQKMGIPLLNLRHISKKHKAILMCCNLGIRGSSSYFSIRGFGSPESFSASGFVITYIFPEKVCPNLMTCRPEVVEKVWSIITVSFGLIGAIKKTIKKP